MRSDVLLFLHVLAGMAFLGGAVAAAAAAFAARRAESGLRTVVWRITLLVVVPAAFATVFLGEGLAAKEDIDAGWLDASYPIAYVGVLVAGVVLAVLARLALGRKRLVTPVALLAILMSAAALAVAFLMTAKPR